MVDGHLWPFFVRSRGDGRDDGDLWDWTVKSVRIRLSAPEGHAVTLLNWREL